MKNLWDRQYAENGREKIQSERDSGFSERMEVKRDKERERDSGCSERMAVKKRKRKKTEKEGKGGISTIEIVDWKFSPLCEKYLIVFLGKSLDLLIVFYFT